jgi:UDP-GlcNAc:undecaprenyl-phosphate/decaprenyl-phosphate GlcNAc-1-phosphate transferase
MPWLCVALIPIAFAISCPLAGLLVRLGHRLRTYDGAGVAGQVKKPPRRVPNTGGIAIFWGVALPILGALAALGLGAADALADHLPLLAPHLPGIREQTPLAVTLVGSLAVLHVMGLIDDRKPLGPYLKLTVMALPALFIASTSDTRLFTLLDTHVGGPWLSILITAFWFLVVTNALNFMDNMDGLSAGVAGVAGLCFLAAALVHGQWFVAACLALLIGSVLGFLVFNFPPARIFMGDGGSLVLGFLMAFLTVRTTYYAPDQAAAGSAWPAVFMPFVVLAVPIYDFISVVAIRLSQGRSPFVGDLQHFSHRLVRRGLSDRAAVLIIWGFTAITGIAGISLLSLKPWQAALVGLQTVLTLIVIALFERFSTPPAPTP